MQRDSKYLILDDKLNSIEKYLIDLRRDLHKHPELGFEEFYTSKKISSILKSLNIKIIISIKNSSKIGFTTTRL